MNCWFDSPGASLTHRSWHRPSCFSPHSWRHSWWRSARLRWNHTSVGRACVNPQICAVYAVRPRTDTQMHWSILRHGCARNAVDVHDPVGGRVLLTEASLNKCGKHACTWTWKARIDNKSHILWQSTYIDIDNLGSQLQRYGSHLVITEICFSFFFKLCQSCMLSESWSFTLQYRLFGQAGIACTTSVSRISSFILAN